MKPRRIPYSDQEMAWLEANRLMVLGDYHRAFVAAFGRDDVSYDHLKALRSRKGWKVGRDGSRYKGRRRKFSEVEIAWLRDNATMVVSEYCREFRERFGHDISASAMNSLRKREGFKTGRTGHFEKGSVAHNKGKRCPDGAGGRHPNARKTQFKKGQLPHNHIGAGHERIDSKDGYVVMIVDETNPWTGAATRPVHKHRYLWERQNGPVPEGMVLKCLDGNKLNTDPSNWELIPRGVLPRLSARFGMGFDDAAPELKPVIMTVAKLKDAATRAKRRLSESRT